VPAGRAGSPGYSPSGVVSLHATGFILAFVCMVLFGLYMVPRKFSSLRDFEFVLSMCIGAAITTQSAQFIAHPHGLPAMAPAARWLSLLCGPIWALGMLSYTLSVTHMGLTLSTPIKNTTAVLGTIFGLVLFAEWRETAPVPAMVGSLLVVACAWVLAACGDSSGNAEAKGRNAVTPLGVMWALLAAFFFAAYTVPLKMAQARHADSFCISALMGLGTLGAAIVLMAIFSPHPRRWLRQPTKAHLWAGVAGVTWALASISMIQAIERIGLAITWPIANLNTLVTVAAGIVLFHEVDMRHHGWRVWAASGLAVVGTLLLGAARL
jgi:glucose uptake protein GlcU